MKIKKLLLFATIALTLIGCKSTIPLQTSGTIYKVGDAYNQNGIMGIVVKVDASGQHGLIMSLEGSNEKWTSDKKFNLETKAFYEDDGQKNMEAIEKYIASGKASWDDFPIFNWARSLGEGWYIPSKNETLEIWTNMNGGSDEFIVSRFGKNGLNRFDKAQRKYKGTRLVDDRFYIGDHQPYLWFTSTEGDGGMVYTVQFGNDLKSQIKIGFVANKFKAYLTVKRPPIMSKYRTRAVRKF